MAELEKFETAATSPSQVTTNSHRQLLASIDKSVDSASDGDGSGTTEDEHDSSLRPDNGDAGSIIGVSISQAQTHMKSPRTPAFEKAQALRDSRGYFGAAEQGIDDENEIVLTESPEQQVGSSGSTATEPLPSPWKSPSRSQLDRRSSLTKNILSSGQNEGRKRSGSGPTAILDGLRKMFTDLQPSGFGSNVKHEGSEDLRHNDHQSASDTRTRSNRSQTMTQPAPRPMPAASLDTATSSAGQKLQRPKALRRTTSDNSLYLKRAVTGASEFDDTSVYASVADMPNSRFKAITDSLADSSLKLPKMPSISFGSSRHSPSRSNSDLTSRNTAFNAGSSHHSEITKGGRKHSPVPSLHSASVEKKNPALVGALSRLTGDAVFMGGYRGSILRSAEPPHHQVWVPVKIGLNLRKVDLEVGLTHEDEERMEQKIIPSGILSHIGPIDIARRLLKKVTTCPNARANQLRVHNYGYDWRLSPHFLSQKLITYLEGLECNHPDTAPERRGALVVAHSLGGLITRHAVNQRPELFSGVVYVGTPQNCVNILGPLRNGDDVLLSSRVLTAQVNFTLRTSYALLPENGRCFVNRETGEQYDVDFFDVNTWDEYRLSPCIAPALPPFGASPKKSLVGSITESISSFTPTLPTRRPSWFPGSHSTESSAEAIQGKAHEAKEEIQSAAKSASENLQSPKREAQDSIEPSMKGTQHKPSVATAVTLPKDKAREYLARTLTEIKQFKAELKHIPAVQDANRYPPHALIFGKSVPTVYGAKVASREAIKCSDAYDDLAFAAGDGVVLASAAQLPQGYRCVKGGRVESDRGHVGLLGDLEAIGKCIAAVTEGRRRGVGMGKPA